MKVAILLLVLSAASFPGGISAGQRGTAPFSVAITAPQNKAKAGSEVKIQIDLKNTSADVAANGSFADALCFVGGWSPHPLPPQSPLSGTEIFYQQQAWWAGSLTSGVGVKLQTNTQNYYIDHGRHTIVVSPIP